jgi:hypothetical protein
MSLFSGFSFVASVHDVFVLVFIVCGVTLCVLFFFLFFFVRSVQSFVVCLFGDLSGLLGFDHAVIVN